MKLEKALLCVDPVAELLFCGSELHNIRILQAGATQFVKMQDIRCVAPCVAAYYDHILHCYRYSKIYMKATVHHIPRDQWSTILEVKYNHHLCYYYWICRVSTHN